ncbi:MAG: glutamate racemase [Clostridia bacterium]|nr:glutamate racemase [Clostridia bacterium]
MIPDKQSPIAVFDSGAGGLSVLAALKRFMPCEDYIFLGDRKNAPYGDKSHDEIRRISLENAGMLFGMGAKALVIACNTATAAAVDTVREAFPQYAVIGIEPAVKPAFEAGCRRIAVLATPRTVSEDRFSRLLRSYGNQYGGQAFGIGCRGLATMIEENTVSADYFTKLWKEHFGDGFPDGIVLGCTHYPFASDVIKDSLPEGIPVFDGADGTARQTCRRLGEAGLLTENAAKGRILMPCDDGFLAAFWKTHCPAYQ